MAVREQLWPVTLRDMRRDDLPAVLDIERRSFSQPWSRAFFEKELATPFARLIVAYTCRWRVTDEVHILNVAVHPDRRGRGFGRLLLEGTLGEARSSRARIVYLEVRAGNVVARRLYRSLGFRELGVRRGYYGPGQDAIVMELRLGHW